MSDQNNLQENALLESILGQKASDRHTPEGTNCEAYAHADQAESAMARPLHGQKDPPVALQKESPAHRVVLLLRARGMSVREIFVHLGGKIDKVKNQPVSGTGMFSYQHLLTISRQPWFKAQLVTILEEAGLDQVQAMLETEVVPSIEELVRIRDEGSTDSVRMAASINIIDRVRGKPTQHIKSETHTKYEKVSTEMDQIDAEINQIEETLASGTN